MSVRASLFPGACASCGGHSHGAASIEGRVRCRVVAAQLVSPGGVQRHRQKGILPLEHGLPRVPQDREQAVRVSLQEQHGDSGHPRRPVCDQLCIRW